MKYHDQHPPFVAKAKSFTEGHLSGQSGHCLLYGKHTAGALSLSVSVLKKGSEAPLHIHSREDETFFIISGSVDARVGDEHHTLNGGDSIFLPRGLQHRLSCISEEAKVIMIIHPAGLESYFDEMSKANAEGKMSETEMIALAEKYGVTIVS